MRPRKLHLVLTDHRREIDIRALTKAGGRIPTDAISV
jgi:hypothetical protein